MVEYVNVDSSELLEILQSELLKRVGDKKTPNNPKGLKLLEEEAKQVCRDILTPHVSKNVNIIATSKGKYHVNVHWVIPGEDEDVIEK